ncbi:hypothetical protein D3C80_1718240 [compost metagenome]
MAALYHLGAIIFHVVAQIVETKLVVGRVGNITGIGRMTLFIRKAMHDDAGG